MLRFSLPLLLMLHSFSFLCLAQTLRPFVTDLTVTADSINHRLDIHFGVAASVGEVSIYLKGTSENGLSIHPASENLAGDWGSNVATGNSKSIIWHYPPELNITKTQLKLVIYDEQALDLESVISASENELLATLEQLDGIRHYTADPEHLTHSQNFISEKFNSNGLVGQDQFFEYQGYQARNIIGLKSGILSDSTIIIDAHYDSVSNSPGADDNASGIAGVLESLRLIGDLPFTHQIKFVAFDLEEEGLLGSVHYVANQAENEKLLGVLNYEMIGFFSEEPNSQTLPTGFELIYPNEVAILEADEFRGNFVLAVGEQSSSQQLLNDFREAAALVNDLKVIAIEEIVGPVLGADLYRSDHAPFWLDGQPALMITDGANFRNPFYHTAQDLIPTLDLNFAKKVVEAVTMTTCLAGGAKNGTEYILEPQYTSTNLSVPVHHRFSVFPNPNSGSFKLILPEKNFHYSIVDHQGKILLTLQAASKVADVKVEDLSAGIYYISVTDGTSSTAQKIIVH